jgi:hypothetical protein
VARATVLRAVADGGSYPVAAAKAGRRSGDGVAQLVARFNQVGLTARDRRPGGGALVPYGPAARADPAGVRAAPGPPAGWPSDLVAHDAAASPRPRWPADRQYLDDPADALGGWGHLPR